MYTITTTIIVISVITFLGIFIAALVCYQLNYKRRVVTPVRALPSDTQRIGRFSSLEITPLSSYPAQTSFMQPPPYTPPQATVIRYNYPQRPSQPSGYHLMSTTPRPAQQGTYVIPHVTTQHTQPPRPHQQGTYVLPHASTHYKQPYTTINPLIGPPPAYDMSIMSETEGVRPASSNI